MPWNPWRQYSISEDESHENHRKASVRFYYTTCCPCKTGVNTVVDAQGSTFVFHEYANPKYTHREDGTVEVPPCEFHAQNTTRIEELWKAMEEAWELSFTMLENSYREDGLIVKRADAARRAAGVDAYSTGASSSNAPPTVTNTTTTATLPTMPASKAMPKIVHPTPKLHASKSGKGSGSYI